MLEGIIIWGVLWFVFAWAGWWISVFGFGFLGGLITDSEAGTVIGAVIGWLIGVAWWIFSIIQLILQIFALVQYLS